MAGISVMRIAAGLIMTRIFAGQSPYGRSHAGCHGKPCLAGPQGNPDRLRMLAMDQKALTQTGLPNIQYSSIAARSRAIF
jgi:hypothetical protein